ncbi:hypothetical protein Pcinc_026207 [Petrolisthes cinctipes]|uniref:Annexin n=1 Tax=Petrolisthes cinctipes TaxID=88211 RepID=A0AAE1KAF8_PETCI|nr:hypothetical protein Pcinc_026207 [Petrolisthes cinctipes]
MDEYSQKISSGNVFLQSQAITKLNTTAVEKTKEISSLYETEEVKQLWQTVNHGEESEASLAVEAVVGLVKLGLLPPPATLQNFLADITCAKSPSALVQGITEMVLLLSGGEGEGDGKCPFTGPPKGPTHPYVTVVTKRPDLMPTVLEELAYLLAHPDPKVRVSSVSHVQPVLLHTFCLTENTLSLARPLLSAFTTAAASPLDAVPLLCRILTLIKDSSRDHVERKVLVVSTLAQLAATHNLKQLQSALLPCIVILIPLAWKQNLGTRTLERYLSVLTSRLGRGCDVTLCALAEVLPQISGALQVNLLKIGATLLSHKDGNPLIGARLLPSLLQVLSAPCTAVSGLTTAAAVLVSLVQATPTQPSSNTQLAGNEYWETLCSTHSSLGSYLPALDFSDRLVKDPQLASDWLTKLADSTNQISTFYHTIVTSVFLYQGSTPQSVQQAAKVVEREVVRQKVLSVEVFPMVLYRLGREKDPATRLVLLYTLPSLAVNKLCVGMVVKTLLALWSSVSLRPVVLRLALDLWTVQPRTYPYLMKLLQDRSSDTREIQIARAFVVSSVCKTKPSEHGEELLPLLSGFLNECKNDEGTAQTLMALDGIYHLCSNQIIDLRTTWRVVAPKLARDKRRGVTEKLCLLLSLVPELKVTSVEYDKFTADCITILWNWATSTRPLSVIKATYKALEKFPYENYKLKMLPQYAKEGHTLPASMSATPFEAARKPEDVLEYVPGLGWVKLVKGCPENHLDCVESFIKSLVAREVAGLPKGIYLTAIQEAKRRGIKSANGTPEPPNYSFFKDSSILKALVQFLIDCPRLMHQCLDANEKQRLLRSAVLMLEALGQSLPRPYPALDWSFLETLLKTAQTTTNYDWIKRIRHSIFQITSRQCNKSASSGAIINQYLIPGSAGLTREDEIVLFGLLDHLGRGMPPTVLQPFLAHVLKQQRSDSHHLKDLLIALHPNLTADIIFDTNRNVISNAVENLNEFLNPEDKVVYEAYKACVADLPQKHIERLTSPSLWWEVTDERLYRAAVLRCHVAQQDPETLALPWLNDLVDSAAGLPGDRSHILKVMCDTLVVRNQAKESTSWFLQLLGRLQEHLKRKPGDNLVAAHEQHQRITFYLDLVVMALIVWSGLWSTHHMHTLATSAPLRDRLILPSLVTLAGQPEWRSTLNQFLNWLVSCHALLPSVVATLYHLAPPTLLLATLNPTLSQSMWNKLVTLKGSKDQDSCEGVCDTFITVDFALDQRIKMSYPGGNPMGFGQPGQGSPYPSYPPAPGAAPYPPAPGGTPYPPVPGASPYPPAPGGAPYPPSLGSPYPPAPGGSPYPPAPGGSPYPPAPGGSPYPPAPGGSPYPPAPGGSPYPPAPGGSPYPPAPGGSPYPPAPGGSPYPPAPGGSPYPGAGGSPYPGAQTYPPASGAPSYPPAPGSSPYSQAPGSSPYPAAPGAPYGGAQPQVTAYQAYSTQQTQMHSSQPMGGSLIQYTEIPTVAPTPHFDPSSDASILRKAMKGLGTDEAAIIGVLSRRTSDERQQILLKYQQAYGRDLIKDLKSELSGKFEDSIIALMRPLTVFLASELHEAMAGIGTNERTLVEILCTRDNASLMAIKTAYQQQYRKRLEEALSGDVSGDFGRLLISMCACSRDEQNCDPALANNLAQQLYKAGEGKLGTNEGEFNRILASYSYPLLRCVFEEYKKIKGKTFGQAIDSELSGDLKIGMKAVYLSIENRSAYFARELHDSMAGMGTKDRALIRLVVSRAEIDMGNIKQEYQKLFNKPLEKAIKDDTSGDIKKLLVGMVEG